MTTQKLSLFLHTFLLTHEKQGHFADTQTTFVGNGHMYVMMSSWCSGKFSIVIAKISPPARSTRLRVRKDENVPKHSRYEIKGEHRYDATVRFNTPLAIAAYLYNMTPDTVLAGVWSAKRVKAALLAFERGESVDPMAGESVPSANN